MLVPKKRTDLTKKTFSLSQSVVNRLLDHPEVDWDVYVEQQLKVAFDELDKVQLNKRKTEQSEPKIEKPTRELNLQWAFSFALTCFAGNCCWWARGERQADVRDVDARGDASRRTMDRSSLVGSL